MHHFTLRVYYEDTDVGGVVYHANYLKFIERARSEWVRACGIDQKRLLAEQGLGFVVRAISAEFVAPARYDDELRVETVQTGIMGVRIELRQRVLCGDRLLFTADVTLAAISREGRPLRLSPEIRDLLAGPAA